MQKMDVIGLHSEFFRTHGFILNPSKMIFEKDFVHGKQVISVQFVEGSTESYLEYHLAIRINEVEELINKYLPTLGNYAEESMTLAQSVDKLWSCSPKRIKFSDEKSLVKLVRSIKNFFLDTGFAWLDQMIDPVVLEQEFLHHKEKPFEDFNLVESAFRSTALSKLYNPKDYPVLRQSFLEKVNSQEMTPFAIASFLQFLNYLDKLEQVAA